MLISETCSINNGFVDNSFHYALIKVHLAKQIYRTNLFDMLSTLASETRDHTISKLVTEATIHCIIKAILTSTFLLHSKECGSLLLGYWHCVAAHGWGTSFEFRQL